jgi:hypothetical protein
MARKPAPKSNRKHKPTAAPTGAAPSVVLDPDHDALIVKYVWSKERTEQFNAADDPIDSARGWLRGYEYRLETADRGRHFAGATQESYRKSLEWADNPKWDRQHEALGILLDRIRNHPKPPYSPEVLLAEHQRLFDMPVHARLHDGFVSRFDAWIDRVETFLSIGASASDAGDAVPVNAIDENDASILAFLNRAPNLRRKVSDVLPDKGPQDRKAVAARLRKLADRTPALVDYPKRGRTGVVILPAGVAALKQATTPR